MKNRKVPYQSGNSSYGWLIVGASTLVMTGFYGTELSYSVFLKPIIGDFGWTRAVASGAMSTTEGIAGVAGIIMGRLTDKYGARMLVTIGALLGVLGYLLMSRVGSLWQLYLYFGLMEGVCIGSCWTPINATVSRWISNKRVLALGITTSGITIGHMFLPPLLAFIITAYGWRFAYDVLAITVGLAAIPAIILLRKNPPPETTTRYQTVDKIVEPDQSSEWSAIAAAKTAPFWMLMIIAFVTAAGFIFMSVHIVAYATDVGITTTSAALILTFMGGANVLGKLLVWQITNRIGSRYTFLLLLAMQAAALFLLIGTKSLWMFFLLASLFGFGLGATSPVRLSMVSEFFGMRSVGTIIGFITVAWAAGGIIGPVMAGYIFDLTNSYDIAFSAGGLLMIIGMVAIYLIKAPQVQSRSVTYT